MTTTDTVKPWVLPTAEPDLPMKAPSPSAPPLPPPAQPLVPEAADVRPCRGDEPDLPPGVEPDSTHAILWRHAETAAAVLRSLGRSDETGIHDGPLAGMSPRRLAAALLSGLGVRVAARVLQELRHDEETARWAGHAVADEAPVTHAVALAVLEYARQRIVAGDYEEEGGPKYARDLLSFAFGEPRAHRLLRGPEEADSGFCFLRDAPAELVAPHISHEHPQTIAILLSQLDPHLAAGILTQLPERMQADVAYRVATMENVPPKVLLALEEGLEASLDEVLGGNQDVGGPKVVADMLNLTGSSVEKNVLDQMDAQDPEVAEAVRNLMFTFADVAKLTDREIQIWLREIDPKDLTVSLKAAGEELRDKVLANMALEERTSITEEMAQLGPMRLSEVEEVQLRCVQQARLLEEKGQITIVRGDAPDVLV